MGKFRKFLVWAAKTAFMTALLAGFIYLWVIMAFGMENEAAAVIILAVSALLYLFICFKVSLIGCDASGKKDKFLRSLRVTIPVAAIASAYLLFPAAMDKLGDLRMKAAEKSCDEAVVCGSHNYEDSKLLVDYDKKTVTFSGYAYYGFDKITEIQLTKGEADRDKYSVQFTGKLSSPGKAVTAFRNDYDNLTSALEVEMENGEIYSAEFEPEYYAVNAQSAESKIFHALKTADYAVVYGRDDQMPENKYGINADTIYFDWDNEKYGITANVVYHDEQSGNVYSREFRFFKSDGSVQNGEAFYIQAEIDMESPAEKLYPYAVKYDFADEPETTTTGIILVMENGDIYRSINQGNYNFKDCRYSLQAPKPAHKYLLSTSCYIWK